MKNVANFLFETCMLQKTPRSGFQFLGSGKESVAEHTLAVIFVAYVLGKLDGTVDEERLMKMCLFHDLPEARTGDMNYVNKKYVTVDEEQAIEDLLDGLPFNKEIKELMSDYNSKSSNEAILAHDADQLSLLLKLRECKDFGNKYSDEWFVFAEKRLVSDVAKKLADTIRGTDSSDWWFGGNKDKSDWWINGNNKK
ncbi:MAG: HD domain-containing protein [Deltaproteobacteria bacterium]